MALQKDLDALRRRILAGEEEIKNSTRRVQLLTEAGADPAAELRFLGEFQRLQTARIKVLEALLPSSTYQQVEKQS